MTPRCRQEFPMLAPWHQRDSYGGGTSVCPRDSWPCSSRVTSCLTPGELSCSLRYWAMRRMILGGFVARRQFEPRPAQGTTSRATPHRPNRDDWCGCTRPCPLFTMWSIGPIAPMCIVRVQRCLSGTSSGSMMVPRRLHKPSLGLTRRDVHHRLLQARRCRSQQGGTME